MRKLRTQLLGLFGVSVIVAVVVYVSVLYGCTAVVAEILVIGSRDAMLKQVSNIGNRTGSEMSDMFQATMDMAASSFLYPVVYGLFDAFDENRPYPVASPDLFMGRNVDALRPPVAFDKRTDEFGNPAPAFICLKADMRVKDDAWRVACSDDRSGVNSGGCSCDGKKNLSTTASSVFVTGMDQSEAEATRLVGLFAPDAKKSGVMDAFIHRSWQNDPSWIQVYLGMEHKTDQTVSLFRSFPGFVRENLELPDSDSKSGRIYNAAQRPWYKQAKEAANAQADKWKNKNRSRKDQLQAARLKVSLTAPYRDADGKGDLVTLTTPVTTPSGRFLGVVGTDLVVQSLRNVVNSIKMRETGEALVFHIESKTVLAHTHLVTAGDNVLPKVMTMPLIQGHDKKFSDIDLPCKDSSADNKQVHGLLLIWRKMWEDKYCLVIVTKVEEIEAPITSQQDEIDALTGAIGGMMAVIGVIVMVLLLTLVVLLAVALSSPMSSTAEDSQVIVASIGGDLSDMANPRASTATATPFVDKIVGKVGEVEELRLRFDALLADLLRKRQKPLGPVNPFYNAGAAQRESGLGLFARDSAALEQRVESLPMENPLPRVAPEAEVVVPIRSEDSGKEMTPPFASPMTRWNSVSGQLRLKLMLPLLLVMLVLAIITFATLVPKVSAWVGPVRDKMIAEEVSSLNQRVRQRATMLQEGLGMGRSTVSMIKSYWLQVLDGNYNWYPSTHVPKLVAAAGAPSFFVKSYFAPFSACTRGKLMDGSVLCGNDATSGLELQAEQGFSIASYEPRKISVEASALYRPEDAARLSSEKLATEAGDSVWSWSNEDEVKGLALLDEVLRAAYFSADVTSVYVATHGSETFKMFPFEDLASYDKEKICDSIMNKPKEVWVPKQPKADSHYKNVKRKNYNPVCRPWYQRAQRNSPKASATLLRPRGDIVFNPIDFDAGTGLPYLALSTAVWGGADQTQLVGVASIDLNIAKLNQTLSQTDLYQRGYVLVWDENGMAVIHKSLKAGLERYDIEWVDATAGGKYELDEDWVSAQKIGMFDKGRVAGTFNFTFKGELWYYTFMPIPETPYMIALSVVYSEVTEQADKNAQKLYAGMIIAVVVGVVISVVAFVILWCGSEWVNKNVGHPVKALADYIGSMREKHYRDDLPNEGTGSKTIQELSDIDFNMRRMVVALRFGDPKFSGGDRDRELSNAAQALKIIYELGNERGKGVCFNNMGNCMRVMEEKFKDHGTGARAAVEQHLRQTQPDLCSLIEPLLEQLAAGGASDTSVANPDCYFQLALADRTNVANASTVSTRLLNRGLYLLGSHFQAMARGDAPIAEGLACLAEAEQSCADDIVLMQMAWGAVRDLKASLYVPRFGPVVQILQRMCQRAEVLMLAAQGPVGLGPDRFNALAQRLAVECMLMGATAGDTSKVDVLCYWALTRVPRMSKDLVQCFVFHLKRSPALVSRVDDLLQEAGFTNVPGPPPSTYFEYAQKCSRMSKDVFICVDVSGSMGIAVSNGNNRLEECKLAMFSLLDANILAEGDRFGFKQFDHKVDTLMPIIPVDDKSIGTLREKVSGMHPRGATLFYTAVHSCVEDLFSNASVNEQWVIALTDGETNFSSESRQYHAIMEHLSQRNRCPLNLVCIIVGPNSQSHLIDDLEKKCHEFNKVIHLKVGTDDIAEAFKQVGEILSGGGISEDL